MTIKTESIFREPPSGSISQEFACKGQNTITSRTEFLANLETTSHRNPGFKFVWTFSLRVTRQPERRIGKM
eukprot:2767416-Rhodomonas_salina.2